MTPNFNNKILQRHLHECLWSMCGTTLRGVQRSSRRKSYTRAKLSNTNPTLTILWSQN